MSKEAPSWFKPFMEMIARLMDAVFKNTEVKPVKKKKAKKKASKTTRNMKIFKMAASQIGVKEIRGRGSNKTVEEYLRWGGTKKNKGHFNDATPWCAGFVGWCLEKANVFSTNSLMARSYERWGRNVKSNPMPGDVVTFWRKSKKSGSGHVGFYIKRMGSHIMVLGGNQSDEVNISTYSTARMTGIWRCKSEPAKYTDDQVSALRKIRDQVLAGKKIKAGGKVT